MNEKTPAKHRYRVTIYLGKDKHEKMSQLAEMMGIPLATACTLMLNTGIELGQLLENQTKGGSNIGNK